MSEELGTVITTSDLSTTELLALEDAIEHAASPIRLDVPVAAVPYAQEWFGPWLMLETHFHALANTVRGMSVKQHLEAQAVLGASRQRPTLLKGESGVAVIPLNGTLQKQQASMSASTSTVEARRLIREAVADEDVKGIMLLIDSPGGTVAGTEQLANEVAKAAGKKPVYAYIDDLGASAAYWVASQATKVFTNASGIVGSIGTFGIVYDYHRAAEQQGIEVKVVRAGEFKGAGVPGTQVTDAHLSDMQRRIDQLNEQFITGVAAGRKLSVEQVRQIADGRVHVGKAAMDLKLVDGIASAEDAIAELVNVFSASPTRRKTMSQEVNAPKAASLAEIKAACKGASPEFVLSQLEAGATIDQAKDAWIAKLADERDAAAEAARAAEAKANKPGIEPIVHTGKAKANIDGDPIAMWNEAVADHRKQGKSAAQASRAVAIENPELREAYVAAYNAKHGRRAG